MAHYLTIDQGNSVAKLALWDGDRMIDHIAAAGLTAEAIERFVGGREIRAALYCSVAAEKPAIISELHAITGDVRRLSARCPMPLRIDYGSPCSLGADRVAAALGAMTAYPGEQCLVVDIGTAVTYDVVRADGTFVGGNIAPGLKMRLDSLHRYTARLPLLNVPDEVDPGEPMLGPRHVERDAARSALWHRGSHQLLPLAPRGGHAGGAHGRRRPPDKPALQHSGHGRRASCVDGPQPHTTVQ